MQAKLTWIPPVGPLGRLTARARERAAELERSAAELRARVADARPTRAFGASLRSGNVGLIAELKRRSPSKGAINPSMSASAQATAYVNGGAAALSVLTEPSEFGGSAADLLEVAAAVQLPLLKKDFHVSPVQLIEARALGASAVLLIARALEPDALRDLAEYAQELGLEVLIEVRDVEELGRALEVQSAVIGVNNRNLETLIIDPDTSARLIPRIPTGRLAVAESGLSARVDVERAAQVGADAVLIGSAVSAAADPESALRALTGVQKVARGG